MRKINLIVATMLSLFWSFFKIGAFTLGGGYAMLPLIQHEIVEQRQWIDEKEFFELLALAQSSPGPIAVNTAVFVGYKYRGLLGAIVATLAITLPSFIIILIIAVYLMGFRNSSFVDAFFKGVKPAIVALISAPLFQMGKKMEIKYKGIALASIATILVVFFNISPAIIIAIATIVALLGALIKRNQEPKEQTKC